MEFTKKIKSKIKTHSNETKKTDKDDQIEEEEKNELHPQMPNFQTKHQIYDSSEEDRIEYHLSFRTPDTSNITDDYNNESDTNSGGNDDVRTFYQTEGDPQIILDALHHEKEGKAKASISSLEDYVVPVPVVALTGDEIVSNLGNTFHPKPGIMDILIKIRPKTKKGRSKKSLNKKKNRGVPEYVDSGNDHSSVPSSITDHEDHYQALEETVKKKVWQTLRQSLPTQMRKAISTQQLAIQ